MTAGAVPGSSVCGGSWTDGPRHHRGCYHVSLGGSGRATRRAASSAGTPSRRSSASASWSTEASATRSGCRWHLANSPSSPPATALSAISGSGTVRKQRPVACPASMSRRARGARPPGMSSASRPCWSGTRRCQGGVEPSRPRSVSPTANSSAGSATPALARSIDPAPTLPAPPPRRSGTAAPCGRSG